MINKFDSETALAKIKVLMNRYYADIGREKYQDVSILSEYLLGDIDEVLDNTYIDRKCVIIESLKVDNIKKEY